MANLLLIEDDPAVAESIIFVLENNNHRATHVSNLEQATHSIHQDNHFDAAIVDVWLSGEDGLSLFQRNEDGSEKTNLPLIVISGGGPGRTLEAVTARADACGAVTVLYKPFSDEDLLGAIAKAIE